MENRPNTRIPWWEVVLFSFLILSLLQTFVEDLGTLALWPWYLRRWFVVSALVFDSIFTLEFTARAIVSQSKGSFSTYIRKDFGWVDFLASVPLLILDSGPRFLAVMAGAPFYSVLIGGLATLRMIRLLRLLRLLRLTARMPHRRGSLSERSVAILIAMVLGGVVFGGVGFGVLETAAGFHGSTPLYEAYYRTVTQEVRSIQTSSHDSTLGLQELAQTHAILLGVTEEGRTAYLRYSPEENARRFGIFDYVRIQEEQTEVYLSVLEVNAENARESLFLFFLGLLLMQLIIFGFLPLYVREVRSS